MALSKTQTKRLGGILTVMFGDDIPSDNLTALIGELLGNSKGKETSVYCIPAKPTDRLR